VATVVLLHRNVDLDAIVSAYLYRLKEDVCGILDYNDISVSFGETDENLMVFTTEEHYEKVLRMSDGVSRIVVLDMPLKEEILKKVEELGVEVEHYDHHNGSAPSTARILWEKFKDSLPEWAKYFVELADFSDTGKVLRLPAPAKYFHITGYINALRTCGWRDAHIIATVFIFLEGYTTMLQKLVEAEKLVEDVPIINLGNYKVAIVEGKLHTVNQTLFEHKNVDFIIFRDGNNLGIVRNASTDRPDLNNLKPILEKELRDKGKLEELSEWFFHPAGFIVARGTRKHPAKTPSALTPQDLLELLTSIL